MGAAPAALAQGTRTQVRCAGQTITEIVIRAQAPGYGGIFSRSPLLGRMVTTLHVTTAPVVIQNFLLLKRGEACNPLLRSESERILRAMPFIADASVTAYPDGMEGVRLEVVTIDEPTLIASLGVDNASPYVRSARLGNANLLGNAVLASAGWSDGRFYRDEFYGRYNDYQLWGRPYQLDLQGARWYLGGEWLAELSYPFLTDVQKSAWRVAAGSVNDFARFRRPDEPPASLEVKRQFMDAGALWRIGRPGSLGLVGAQLSMEQSEFAGAPVVITDSGLVNDTTPALIGRFDGARSVRLNALLGYRRIQFMRVTGFDALSGPQDLRTGIQIGVTLGRSLPSSTGAAKGEMYSAVNAYLGRGTPYTFAGVEADFEGRRGGSGGWNDVITSGRAAWYLKPHPRHLVTADLIWGAGWEVRMPYQLSLGDSRGGLRGYRRVDLGGARRVVARLEERWRVGSFRGTATGGVGVFSDLGFVNAGDVPLGLNSGFRQSVGIALMAAVPPRSQRMFRLDIAYPLQRGDGARWFFRLSSEDRTRLFWRTPDDIGRARERVVPRSIFSWP